ncbi:MAG TPA: hypothetical protein PK228_18575, partial [Saprospiraceae bacterium]|nr:hypothetical protein [Saprospiraceae bacterium]
MKHIYSAAFQSIILLVSAQTASAQTPTITAATPVSNTVEQWGKFEVKLDITATWANPYDYDEIRVGCTFTDPDGVTRTA